MHYSTAEQLWLWVEGVKDVPLLVLCAISEEVQGFRGVFEQHGVVFEEGSLPGGRSIWKGTLKEKGGHCLELVVSVVGDAGDANVRTAATELLNLYHPRLFIMTGVCGGRRGAVELGDIVIASEAFDGFAGKATIGDDGQSVLLHQAVSHKVPSELIGHIGETLKGWQEGFLDKPKSKMYHVQVLLDKVLRAPNNANGAPKGLLKAELKKAVHMLDEQEWVNLIDKFLVNSSKNRDGQLASCYFDWVPGDLQPEDNFEPRIMLTQLGKDKILQCKQSANSFPIEERSRPAARVGSVISSNVVRSDMTAANWAPIIEFARNALSVEMEAYGLFQATSDYNRVKGAHPHCDVVFAKGVMDLSDPLKDDSFKDYASRAAAQWAWYFLYQRAWLVLSPSP